MEFNIEKFISPFIESQFPSFYREEGPNFILFVKAYYEWLEQDSPDNHLTTFGGPLNEARELFDYRDIDNTLEQFLEHFQKKYLYGIPFNVIVNKRLLLKYIFDVYRSKGSTQSYKLLFKLIYDEDIDTYLPGVDILKPSDGKWVESKYIEITNSSLISSYVGKKIIGVSSRVTAVVENFTREPVNKNIIYTLNISNVEPKRSEFYVGEKLILADEPVSSENVLLAPSVLGSLSSLNITNGGEDFQVGDILQIVRRDVNTGDVVSFGVDGIVKVNRIANTFGSIGFKIINGGWGYTTNAIPFFYPFSNTSFADHATYNVIDTIQSHANQVLNATTFSNAAFPANSSANVSTVLSEVLTGTYESMEANASFKIGSVSDLVELRYHDLESVTYNTDLIVNHYTQNLNSTSFNFPNNPTSNISSRIGSAVSYNTNYFGSFSSFTDIKTGNNYTKEGYATLISGIETVALAGTVKYNNTYPILLGTNTHFTDMFINNSIIVVYGNPSLEYTTEYLLIKEVIDDVTMKLYAPPRFNSGANTIYKACPPIIQANFAEYESLLLSKIQKYGSLEANISAQPYCNGAVAEVESINSGKGYSEFEDIQLYFDGGIQTPVILNSGSGYSNGDALVFSGGTISRLAEGFVTTNSNGNIIMTTLTFKGAGYSSPPSITVSSTFGNGAILQTEVTEVNPYCLATGKVVKSGVGKKRGYWETTDSFLNSDKYLQDSYYYQDYSYQIDVPLTLNKYKEILYNTFHVSGTALFGKYVKKLNEVSRISIVSETYTNAAPARITSDTTEITNDTTQVLVS